MGEFGFDEISTGKKKGRIIKRKSRLVSNKSKCQLIIDLIKFNPNFFEIKKNYILILEGLR